MTLVYASAIFGPAFVDPRVAELLSDEAYFRALLEVEVALARVQGELGIIAPGAAAAIEAAASSLVLDAPALAAGVLRDGIPVVALVAQLRAAAAPGAAQYVHWGATSQDIMDCAMVLGVQRILQHLEAGLERLVRILAALAEAHRGTVMAARTHGQQALPTSFGLKVAGWLSPLLRHRQRLLELRPRLCVVQLGGAAGTLSAFGPRALELADGVARELGLGVPGMPWHAQRDSVCELGGWLSLVAGSLGKLAQDIILLSQSEVGEVSEAPHGVRGGSSSMPQKNNPMRSEQILASARATAAQLSALHHALVQEHERGTHGWQVEWLCLGPMLMACGGALRNAELLMSELQVDAERMRRNVLAEHGLILAEAAVGVLSSELLRPEAQVFVKRAAARARGERRFFVDVLREDAAGQAKLSRVDWDSLGRPENHLGHAGALIDRVLAQLAAQR